MSYRHITLTREPSESPILRYKIFSPDFSENQKAELLAVLIVNMNNRHFELQDSEIWTKRKLYPLELFQLPPAERSKIVQDKYPDFGSGAWVKSVFDCATELANGTRIATPELNLVA